MVTVLADDQPLGWLLADVAEQCGLGVVVPRGVEAELVTASYIDAPAMRVFEDLVGPLGLVPMVVDDTVIFVAADKYQHDLVMLHPQGLPLVDLLELVKAIAAKAAVPGEVFSVGDRVAVLAPSAMIDSLLEHLAPHLAYEPDQWMIDAVFLSVSSRVAQAMGVTGSASGRVVAGVDTRESEADLARSGADIVAALEVLAEFSSSASDVEVLTHLRVPVVEGSTMTLQQGDQVPVPKRTVSISGVVETTGFDVISTGIQLSIEAARLGDALRVLLTPTVSAVSGVVADIPVVTTSTVTTVAVLESSEWTLISGLDALERRRDVPGVSLLGSHRQSAADARTVVLIRATRSRAGGERVQWQPLER